jgi:hypothetical protein
LRKELQFSKFDIGGFKKRVVIRVSMFIMLWCNIQMQVKLGKSKTVYFYQYIEEKH